MVGSLPLFLRMYSIINLDEGSSVYWDITVLSILRSETLFQPTWYFGLKTVSNYFYNLIFIRPVKQQLSVLTTKLPLPQV